MSEMQAAANAKNPPQSPSRLSPIAARTRGGDPRVMHALQAPFKVFLKLCIGLGCRTAPGDNNVVVAGTGKFVGNLTDDMLQAAANAVTHHRVTDFFCDCETKARRRRSAGGDRYTIVRRSRLGLENKCDILTTSPAPDAKKVLPCLQSRELHGRLLNFFAGLGRSGRISDVSRLLKPASCR